jgi:hypothetical protein
MAETTLPHNKEIRDLFLDLLDRPITVTVCDPFRPTTEDLSTAALYVDDRKQTAAVIGLDLTLSAWSGAALGLVPPGGAQDEVKARVLSQSMKENLYEVLNIAASVFNKAEAPHLRLHSIYAPGEPPPSDVAELLKAIGSRMDLEVEIGGYGKGKLCVVLPN